MNSIKKHNQSVENLWNAFLKANPNNPIKKIPLSFYFCDNKKDADICANLVVKGKKKPLLPLYGGLKHTTNHYLKQEINLL